MQGSSFIARLHDSDFYVVLRKLIPKLQAFSQRIQETSMVRFYSSIYADDKMLIRQMSCDHPSLRYNALDLSRSTTDSKRFQSCE